MRWTPDVYEITRMDHDGYVEAPVSTTDEYPPYIEEEVDATVRRVQDLQGFRTFSFAFMTDNHYAVRLKATHQIRFRRTLRAYQEIAKRIHLDYLALGGDHTNDGDKQYKSECFREMRAELSGLRYFPVNGNHDNNSLWDYDFIPSPVSTQHLLPEEQYVLFYNGVPAQGGVFNRTQRGLYYYCDNTDLKVRSIFLDTIDCPYILDNGKLRYLPHDTFACSQAQLDWLTGDALQFSEPGWTVVLFAHVSPVQMPKGSDDLRRISILDTILSAYQEGKACHVQHHEQDFAQCVDVDFSSCTRGTIACVMLGHSHIDQDLNRNGIQYIETGCAVMYTGSSDSIPRKDGEKSEILFDIVTLDLDGRQINLTRVGAGQDRSFSY